MLKMVVLQNVLSCILVKQQACWNGFKGRTLNYGEDLETCLALIESARTAKRDKAIKKAMVEGINAHAELVTLWTDFWKHLLEWGLERKRLTPRTNTY